MEFPNRPWPGCKIHKEGEGANKKVDIQTAVGSFHVNTQVDPKDTGLAVYPGATRAEGEEHKHAANLTIDSSLFGVKVVAVKFHSDDPPDKLIDFYRNQLKAYGDVTECHGNAVIKHGDVNCLHAPRDQTDLVAGTEERHHAVLVNRTATARHSNWRTSRPAGRRKRCRGRCP
jgi:hypothetical protein